MDDIVLSMHNRIVAMYSISIPMHNNKVPSNYVIVSIDGRPRAIYFVRMPPYHHSNSKYTVFIANYFIVVPLDDVFSPLDRALFCMNFIVLSLDARFFTGKFFIDAVDVFIYNHL